MKNKSTDLLSLSKLPFAGVCLLTLAACGGGGGGNSNNLATAGTEYSRSTGLSQIKAEEGYARITGAEGGQGVTIAILDDGIDEDHLDLAPNLIASIIFPAGATGVDSQHGTAVAGIAAGARNGSGTQGVAFNAGLLAYQIGDQNPDDPNSAIIDPAAVILSIDDAIARGADIMNMSFGRAGTGPLLLSDGTRVDPFIPPEIAQQVADRQAAVIRATAAGKLIVISAGNDANDLELIAELRAPEDDNLPEGSIIADTGPHLPAIAAASPEAANGVIAVMAVDRNNRRASFSNSCLGAEERCMAAPGTNFLGAQPGGGTGRIGSGTSYAAPLVTGAAAVVQAAFPGVTPQEAGNRLLSTATDLGAAGTDSIFGRGLLNLDNALTPQGTLTVATSASIDGPKVALSGSSLSLGSALSLNGAGAGLLGEVVTLDDDNFPFGIDLGRSAAVQSRTTGLDAFIGSDARKTASIVTDTGGLTLSLAGNDELDDPYRAEFAASDTSLKEEAPLPRMQMQSEMFEGVDLFMAFNGSSNAETGLVQTLAGTGDFFQPTAFLAPFDQLSGELTGGGSRVALGDDLDLTVSAFASTEDDTTRQVVMQKIELAYRTAGDIELRLGYGFMQEDGGFLGSEATGAFGSNSEASSQYLDISLLAPLSDKVDLFGAYSEGNTDTSGSGSSLLSDYSTIRSEAFGVGLVMSDVAEEGDGLSFIVGQPLRVNKGSADVTVPVGRTEDGTVLQRSGTLDLSPEGREIAIEAVYNVALDDESQSLSAGSFVRLNPDHDSNASPDIGVGVSYKLTF